HNPTPAGFSTGKGGAYESPARDKTRGRIYRLVYTKAKDGKQPNLTAAKPADLVEALKSDNMFWRQKAQRLLVEAGDKSVAPAVSALAVGAQASPQAALHALWVLDGLKAASENTSASALGHSSPAVRRAALQTLPKDARSVDAILGSKCLDDADPRVRLAALLALADQDSSAAAGAVLAARLSALDATTERGIADATLAASVTHAGPVLAELAKSKDKTWSTQALATADRIASSYAAKAPSDLGTLLGALGNSTVSDVVVTGLAAGWPSSKPAKLSGDDEAAFVKAMSATSATSRGRLLKLAAAWGVKGLDAQLGELAKGLLVTVADDKAGDATRVTAAKQIVEFLPADEAAAEKLAGLITAKASPELVAGLLDALAGSKAKAAGPTLVAKLPSLPPAVRPLALRVVLARPEPTKAFLDAVEKGALRFDMLDLDQKTALAAHPNAEVAERANKLLAMGGGLPDADRQKVIDQFHEVIQKTGDAGQGKKAFATHCAKCHKHGGEGAQIGPDLTGFAVHPKEEILIAVLDPSLRVEGNFKAYTARLLDGRVVTGLLSAQTKTTVELLDAENKKHAISTADLDELVESKKSLMPEGFEKQMTKAELTDLLEFLTLKGKYVPIPLDKVATVVSTRGMFFEANGQAERLVFRDWKPKEFNGVPFHLVDPAGDAVKNVVMLNGRNGDKPPKMPKSVTLPCNTPA
ncbi:MAG: c-type cytochrome, partial [Gemmataceae bacterium]